MRAWAGSLPSSLIREHVALAHPLIERTAGSPPGLYFIFYSMFLLLPLHLTVAHVETSYIIEGTDKERRAAQREIGR